MWLVRADVSIVKAATIFDVCVFPGDTRAFMRLANDDIAGIRTASGGPVTVICRGVDTAHLIADPLAAQFLPFTICVCPTFGCAASEKADVLAKCSLWTCALIVVIFRVGAAVHKRIFIAQLVSLFKFRIYASGCEQKYPSIGDPFLIGRG